MQLNLRAKPKTSFHSKAVTFADQANQKDVRTLVETLPQQLGAPLLNHPEIGNLVEIVLDLGRKPQANFGKHEDQIRSTVVSDKDLQLVVSRVDQFGEDNQAGIDGTLHRVSCIRSRRGTVIGLTLKVGKAVKGSATILTDILKEGKSVLFLGAPGIGKTTAARDVARVMSKELKKRVVIVDSSNQIGGYGNIPHPSIGGARRMQVSNIDKQHTVMMEAMQNHRPEVVIVDEVGRSEEVDACRSIRKKGVQIIATTHALRLENLVKDPELVAFLGTSQITTDGDVTASKWAEGSDSSKKRNEGGQCAPAFDVLVEMRSRDEWFIHDAEMSVDQIMNGQQVGVQVRSRHSVTGAIQERAMTYRPSIAPAGPSKKPTQKGADSVNDAAKNAPRNILVFINEHSQYFKAAVVAHVSKRLQEEGYFDEAEVGTEALHNRIMKITRKKMRSILLKMTQLEDIPNLESNYVLLNGGLELWLRRVVDVHGLSLTQNQYECASQLLASHAAQYLEQYISDLQPSSDEYEDCEEYEEYGGDSEEYEEYREYTPYEPKQYEESKQYEKPKQFKSPKEDDPIPHPVHDGNRREVLENGLRQFLIELIKEQRPSVWFGADDLHAKMLSQLKKTWDSPGDIGTIHNTFNRSTDAQEELYLHLRKIVAFAGKGVKGVSGEEIKTHASHLTGVANCMVGEL
ncbi:hypothetical protein BSKO_04755 [Bryopsis sp. KO-2023]|nr:hypothetical protein BSKO_04755 [Bryopsis sp. KO-2023]